MDEIKKIIWEPKKRCEHIPFEITSRNSNFIPLNFISQNGPQCGFAALCMVASFVGLQLHPDDLVFKAKQLKITNYGEMFSTSNMVDFAQSILKPYFEVILMASSINGFCYHLKKYIDKQNLVLIPYDCDFNNEPCLRNGSNAHWAIICGYIDGGNEDNFYVLACHGKSQFVSAWKFSDLQRSNDNLCDLGIKRKMDSKEYILPPEGLKMGIASQWILFKKRR